LNAKKKQLLLDFPWGEHFPELVAFTEWCIQRMQWNSGVLPMGHTAESIVQDVITKTFSEERNWDPEKGDLLMWLKYVIRSEISHLAESAANKVEVPLDPPDENDSPSDGLEVEQRQLSAHQLMTGSPEELVIAAETEAEKMAEAQSKIDALLEASSGRPELEEIVYAIIDGKCDPKPQELAVLLGRPVGEINQNLRALRRRAEKIRLEVRNGRE
jgi:DNA-directed RNA polymerase specialized sigma24 family protein